MTLPSLLPNSPADQILSILLESAEQARAAKQVAFRLFESVLGFEMKGATVDTTTGEEKPFTFSGINPGRAAQKRYRDFFQAVDVALLYTMVLGVMRIFDKDGESKNANIDDYLKLVRLTLGDERFIEFKRRLKPLRKVVEQLRPVRRELVAHISALRSAEEVLKESSPYALISREFLDQLADLLNDLKAAAGLPATEQVTKDERYGDATRGMMHALVLGIRQTQEGEKPPELPFALANL